MVSQQNMMVISLKSQRYRLLEKLDPELFDGHTEFANMTMEERIMWLVQITIFLFEVSQSLMQTKNI